MKAKPSKPIGLRTFVRGLGFGVALAGAMALGAISPQAQAKELKIGFVMFLSGAAAGPFGVPARNAAELMIEAINKGTVPAPYGSAGIAGAMIVPVFVDEASKEKVADYRKLVQKDDVDLVIGYISSGSCKALGPVVARSPPPAEVMASWPSAISSGPISSMCSSSRALPRP